MLGFSHTREWVYPQSIGGTFMRLRRWTFLALHVVLFVVPWITVRGHPLLQIDLPARRLFLFGAIYTPSDTVFLLLLLLFTAFALFFFTAVFGRIWCGYACPQTVFLESWIRPLELWIEGDRISRKRRDARGLHFDLVWRKALKWTAFLVVSALLAMAMVSLFAGARALWTGQAGPVAYAFVAVFTGAWYLDFTWFREQFCNYLCPYARFQSALTDSETLLISYDEDRGEPRGGGKAAAEDGRCIACSKCVVVCPQGIDIRDGFQLECIQCARCVDACTSVMEPLGHPTLVRYSSIAVDEGRPRRPWRPRTLVYGGLLGSLVAASVVLLLGRVPFEANVNRAPGSLFTVDADGFVRNTFFLRIINKDAEVDSVAYRVSLEGLEGAELLTDAVVLASNATRTLPLIVRVPAASVSRRSIPIRVRISTETDELVLPTTFTTGGDLGAAAGI
ncbi:MAG: cytochrome c oxidase accessory protein CcoG [Longimicrobiales bacterium]|nr:cytochrome c oxidase accessory protein CcoG [Longimicrobiales bacterium]